MPVSQTSRFALFLLLFCPLAVRVHAEPNVPSLLRPPADPDMQRVQSAAELESRIHRLEELLQGLREQDQREAAESVERNLLRLRSELKALQRPRTNLNDFLLPGPKGAPETLELLHHLHQRHNELNEQVARMNDQLAEVRKMVRELHELIAEQRERKHVERLSKVDLVGAWRMVLPGNHTSEVTIEPRHGALLNFKSKSVLAGIYERRGIQLKMKIPNDERLTEFVWEMQDDDSLILIESSKETGSDYTGAILTRIHTVFEQPDPKREL